MEPYGIRAYNDTPPASINYWTPEAKAAYYSTHPPMVTPEAAIKAYTAKNDISNGDNIGSKIELGGQYGGEQPKGNDYLGYANVGIQGLGVLGNLYYADKNQKLKENMYDDQKKAIAQSDARKTKFANRVGGTY
jgi:lipopolysaccharide export LptBFGC system permease protein LptF